MADHALAERLQREVIRPQLVRIVRAFYCALAKHEGLALVAQTRERLWELERHQQQYLRSLGMDFDTEGYFETRLRLGLDCARMGMPLALFQSAHAAMTVAIVEGTRSLSDAWELSSFAHRILALDLCLATEVYHRSQVKHLERKVARTRRDSLTGVLRRESVMEMLEASVERARGTGEALSLALVDVDEFKQVNDRFGHLVGDEVLSAFASRLDAGVRSGDAVGRYGGDEFLIVLHDARIDSALEIAERARTKVAAYPFDARGHRVHVTASLGVAQLAPGEGAVDVLARADVALYRAKREGRDRAVPSQPPVDDAATGTERTGRTVRLGAEESARQARSRAVTLPARPGDRSLAG